MKLNDKKETFQIGGLPMHMQSSLIVELKEEFVIYTEEQPIVLEVNVSADMNEIPEEYREIFLNMLTTKYLNKVNFSDNTFSKYHPPKKTSWWSRFKNIW
jgi:hypothetical protein